MAADELRQDAAPDGLASGAADPLPESAASGELNLAAESRPAHVGAPRRKTARKRGKLTSLGMWLAVVGAVAWGGWRLTTGYLDGRVDLNAASNGGQAGAQARQEREYQQPKPPVDGIVSSLSMPELLWCLRWQLWIETLTAEFVTEREKSVLVGMRGKHALLCDYSAADAEAIAQAQQLIKQRGAQLARQAVDDQLLIISDLEQSWSRSQLILAIQQLLNGLGYSAGEADGLYGARTQQAIKRFQQDAQVLADGEASLKVLQQLRAARRAQQTGSG